MRPVDGPKAPAAHASSSSSRIASIAPGRRSRPAHADADPHDGVTPYRHLGAHGGRPQPVVHESAPQHEIVHDATSPGSANTYQPSHDIATPRSPASMALPMAARNAALHA